MRRTASVILGAVLALLLSACGGDSSGSTDAGTHNDSDVSFATDMIPHHAQAVEMSDILLAKDGVDPQVVQLAEQIKAAQTPEIDTMSGWLQQWGEDVPPTAGMSGMATMPGMMSPDDLAQLEAASGEDASRLFLEQMTEHHNGAIDMAEQEVEAGSYADAISLATSIIESQQAEIDTMADLLAGM